jgi:hypothetical protein
MPYDGSSKAFTIGIRPIEARDWIDVDDRLADYLDEKAALATTKFAEIFAAEPGTEDAQAELRDLLVDHLLTRYPDIYRRDGFVVEIAGARRVDVNAVPALWTAASLVQDDLVLMRRESAGWRVAAAALAFPSSWRLADKFGRPMHEVHGPVPGFGAGSRPNELIGRMFDSMRPDVVVMRWNWSLFGDDRLFHPESSHGDASRFGPDGALAHLRIERQTLRKLTGSGDIVFAIRIYVEPLAALAAHPEGPRIAAAIREQVAAMSDEQAGYKGLLRDREVLLDRLARLASR